MRVGLVDVRLSAALADSRLGRQLPRSILKALTWFALCLLLVVGGASDSQATDNDLVSTALRQLIDSGEPAIGNEDRDDRVIEVYLFYAEDRDYKPMWVRDNGPKSKAREVLDVLRNAGQMGLDPANYRVTEIEGRMAAATPGELAELELLISRAFIDFGRDVHRGRTVPSAASPENAITAEELGPLTLIGGAENASSIGDYVKSIEPQTPQYSMLKEALANYREIERQGGWSEIAKGPALKPGDSDRRVPAIRQRLKITGDLHADAAGSGDLYDPDLVAAVKWFQYRHGLTEDGIVAATTLGELNVPIGQRIRQIELNLERRRWMDDDLGAYYVFVNIADQFLKVVKDGRTIHTARLVVGKPTTRTPVFSSSMKYIVINPYWNVPAGIANGEYLPLLRKDPGALRRQSIRIFASAGDNSAEVDPFSVNWSQIKRVPYALRQDSGPKNALGRIKFMFPNRFDVYVHDTPSKSLFERELRLFSHGCMRVEDPALLAAVLLAGQGWTEAKITAAIASGKQRIVTFATPIPVHVTYLTAWVNKDKSVQFRRDAYGRDRLLDEKLMNIN